MTPQEQEVAFQQQALENGQASLDNIRREFEAARAAGASAGDLAEIQQRIDGQIRVNVFTSENLADAQRKAGQAAINPNVNDAEVAAKEVTPDTDPSQQIFDDGSTLQTFDDGTSLATDADGSTTEIDPFTESDTGLNVLAEDQFTETDTGLNVLTEEIEESPINDFEPDTPEELGGDSIDAGAQTGAETSDQVPAVTRGISSTGRDSKVPFGATKSSGPGAQAQWSAAKDLRVKLRVPNEYLKGPSAGPANIIQKNGGILFPYTPTISMDNQAQYASQTPLHSIYPLNFYKNSTLSPITVSAKFTVQNEFEGAVLLGVIHLLRSLTKMKFGNDPDAGSPPPVCRFDAYGDYMMYNVPVAISSWRHELPDSVDYIAVGRPGSPTTYGRSMVPVMSTISLTMNVMYSRREMLAYNVKDWLSGSLARRGYL